MNTLSTSAHPHREERIEDCMVCDCEEGVTISTCYEWVGEQLICSKVCFEVYEADWEEWLAERKA